MRWMTCSEMMSARGANQVEPLNYWYNLLNSTGHDLKLIALSLVLISLNT